MARTSIIGRTTCVIGNVAGAGDLEILGRVQGNIELDGALHVAEQGTVLARCAPGTFTSAAK